VRLAIYCDYSYRRKGDEIWAQKPVVVFLAGLGLWLDRVTLVGRLDPAGGEWAYRVPPGVDFAPLPHYPSLARPGTALRALANSIRRFWTVLDDVDGVWLLGPHPFGLIFAALAWFRGRTVSLGVRQDYPAYVKSRHPRGRMLWLAALALEGAWRLLARRYPVVVVGPDLARRYRRARHLLPISISLLKGDQAAGPEALEARDYDGDLRVLSVGRLEAEKNPLLLADVLAALGDDPRWRMIVCGDGPMAPDLAQRLEHLGVADRAELRGFVSLESGLVELYRSSHLLLHCSWTEGLPQVLLEASASRLPMVATAVGGVPQAVEGAALLIAPGDASAAAVALRRLAGDADLRRRLTDVAADRAREHSLEAGTERVARFLGGDPPGLCARLRDRR
jgi:glycosyltransferase involved in cell wall biosynthesis